MRTQTGSQHPFIPITSTGSVQVGSDLQSHVIRTGGQQAAGGIPLDGIHLVLQSQIIRDVNRSGLEKSGLSEQKRRLTVCPWKVLTGLSWPSLQTWMHMSVLQEAKVLLLCQSTSRAGAVGRQRRKAQDGCSTGAPFRFLLGISTGKSHLSERETAALPLLCGRPK